MKDICHAIHFATLDESACTLTLNATAPMNVSLGMYGVAVQLEDYASAASTKPISSVGLIILNSPTFIKSLF